MSQEDKPVAEVLSTQVEAWQREVSALQEKIAFAIGKPVAAQELETESFVQTVPDHCDRIVWKGTYIHLPIANAAPCARCTELEAEIMCIHDVRDNKPWRELREAQAKITEQAARIKALESECRKLRDALSETEAFCKRKDITIERQRKVIELCEEGLRQWHVPKNRYVALEAIAELEQGVV